MKSKLKLENKKIFLLHRCASCDMHFWKAYLKKFDFDVLCLLNNDPEFKTEFKSAVDISELKKTFNFILNTICESIKRIKILYFLLFKSSKTWLRIKSGKFSVLNKYIYITIIDEINKFASLNSKDNSLKLNYFFVCIFLYLRACNNIAFANFIKRKCADIYIGYGHKVYTDYIFDLFFHINKKYKITFFSLGHYSKNINDIFFSSSNLCKKNRNLETFVIPNKTFKDAVNNINVIYLPVLGDSPNHAINWSRIFSDYYSWLKFSLISISDSSEKWILRIHPQAKCFNEDTKHILLSRFGNLINKNKNLFIHNPDETFFIKYNFKNIHRIVTFAGTIADESVCHSKKPILINTGLTNTFNSELAWVPNSKEIYKKLISDNLSKETFILDYKESDDFIKYLAQCPRSKNDKLQWKTGKNGSINYKNKDLFKEEEIINLMKNINYRLEI